MRRIELMVSILSLTIPLLVVASPVVGQQAFTLEQILSAPFPADLVATKTGNRLAWSLDQEGRRNIWVAEGPTFTARQVTNYTEDDGAELSDLRFSPDGNAIVYVRGEGKNSAGEYRSEEHTSELQSLRHLVCR